MGNRPELSVVIPMYREGAHLSRSIGVIREHIDALGLSYEMLLVDDGSPDNTWREMEQLAKANQNITGLRLSRNFGKEAAVWAGIEHAQGNAIIIMDGDLQHPPALIGEMVRLWKDGHDIVDAVKTRRGTESRLYRMFAFCFSKVLGALSGFDLMGASDFKLIDRRAADVLLRLPESQTFYRGLTEWIGFRHGRVAMEVADRTEGRSTWSLFRLVYLAFTAITSFSTVILHLVTLIGLAFIFLAVLFGGYVLASWVRGDAIEGFPTVILLQLITGGCIMLSLGLIGEYLARLYWEGKRRPRFIVMEQTASSDSGEG